MITATGNIYKEIEKCKTVPMEPSVSVQKFCSVYGCSLENASIPCLFCRCTLSYQDLCAFSAKCLNLVYRDYTFHAACTTCLRLSAVFEERNYYQCTTSAAFIESLCGSNISFINVRCEHCMKRLDNIEKLDCLERGDKFHLIRGIWRSPCRLCKLQ